MFPSALKIDKRGWNKSKEVWKGSFGIFLDEESKIVGALIVVGEIGVRGD